MGKQNIFQGMTNDRNRLVGFAWGQTLEELTEDVKVLEERGYRRYGNPFLGGTNKDGGG